jgi:hypothetical protein
MLLVKSMTARLAARPLPEFHYRDFGSLVSLGAVSAVGSLMGRLIGGSLLIEGLVARWMYAMLYKLHQVSVHGYYRVVLDTLGRFLRRRLEPRVKLHCQPPGSPLARAERGAQPAGQRFSGPSRDQTSAEKNQNFRRRPHPVPDGAPRGHRCALLGAHRPRA